jgi:2-polyprenyl-6-methoxyphenol hydroxylase-like FAD-dependent oxidoreductase
LPVGLRCPRKLTVDAKTRRFKRSDILQAALFVKVMNVNSLDGQKFLADTAIVIGAGIGGLTATAALADFFARVIVLERDELPDEPGHRASLPHGRHVHALLGGGLNALEELLRGFSDDIAKVGAVRVESNEVRVERPGFDPFPQRDLRQCLYSLSRPLLESELRRRVSLFPNVTFRSRCRVREILGSASAGCAQGVRFENRDDGEETLAADFVVDATGRGVITLAFLKTLGFPLPVESRIGIDLSYVSATFVIPDDAPSDWKALQLLADPRGSGQGGVIAPIEGGRWMLTVSAMHGGKPPHDYEGFLRYVKQLRTPTMYNAIRNAELVGGIERFAFPENVRRHFERLESFPRGLLPMADAACRFNPKYGQGMSVAAAEALALRRQLALLANQKDWSAQLASAYFQAATPMVDMAWGLASLDFAYPQTRGTRPESLNDSLKFLSVLVRLAARDPEVHKLMNEVQQLMRPSSVYREPALMQQIAAEMASI